MRKTSKTIQYAFIALNFIFWIQNWSGFTNWLSEKPNVSNVLVFVYFSIFSNQSNRDAYNLGYKLSPAKNVTVP